MIPKPPNPPLNSTTAVVPQMPVTASTDADMAQVLYCKIYHLNSYRKDLIRRDAIGENVTTPYADATAEVQACLAKLQALANKTLAVTAFPDGTVLQTLITNMATMESAITHSAQITLLIGFGDTVVRTIPAGNIH